MKERHYTYRKRKPAIGWRERGKVKVVCCFDEETFEIVRGRAIKKEISLAEEVRTLVEWGLEADKK